MMMSVKKFLIYSGVVAWSLVLVIAVVGALVHQVRFQDSHDQIYLQMSVDNLKADLDYVHTVNDYYYETILRLLSEPYVE